MENRTELQPYSVLMSVYSGEKPEFFAQSLESLYTQTYPADEIVVVCDGELNEGSNWEAAMSAAQFKLSNVVVLADVNKCMIDGRVDDEMKVEPVDKKVEAFGFNVIRVDGHNFKELNDAIESAIKNHQNGGDKPTAIVMDTFKGEGVDFMKDNYLWHYGSLDEEKTKQAYASLDAYYKERCERAEKEA